MTRLGDSNPLSEKAWLKIPYDVLWQIFTSANESSEVKKIAQKVFIFHIIKKARKTRTKNKVTMESAIGDACKECCPAKPDQFYWEACTYFRKIGGRFGKYVAGQDEVKPETKLIGPVFPTTLFS
jgi:hypothetical protein